MKEIVIFGTGKIAEVIYYYAHQECGFKVAAFTTDAAYLPNGNTFLEKTVVAFQEVEHHYPPAQYDLFVAIGYHDLNKLRETRCQEAKDKGYQLVSIVPASANLPSNVVYGDNCFIMPPALIHPCVTIGNNVFVWNGAMIGHHSVIGDNCWITSCANISGDVVVGKNCFFAVNATVGHGVKIGEECFFGANSLLTQDVDADKVLINPSTKPFRLNSKQFLRMSTFGNL